MTRYILILIAVLMAGQVEATTYYVADSTNADPSTAWGGAPSDGNAGTSWATAFATTATAMAAQSRADTIFWSTGTHIGEIFCSTLAVYACSSFADTNADGDWHFAKIHGGDQITGWTIDAGNIYTTTHADPSYMFQDDTLLLRVLSYGALAEGTFYASGGTLYVWAVGGDDPDNHYVCEAGGSTTWGAVLICGKTNPNPYNDGFAYSADSFLVYGLELKYGSGSLIWMNPYVEPTIGATFRNCKFSMVQGQYGGNPALVATSSNGAYNINSGIRFVRDSMTGCYAITNDGTAEYFSKKGWLIDDYSMKNCTVDSNWFYGHASSGAVYLKHAYAGTHEPRINWVIAYNDFNMTGGSGHGIYVYAEAEECMIYGNTFRGNGLGGVAFKFFPGSWLVGSIGRLMFTNNSIYGMNPVRFDDEDNHYQNEGGPVPADCIFKYNAIYVTGNMSALFDTYPYGADSMWAEIDSNMYYSSGTSTWEDADVTTTTFSTWQSTGGWDAHSTDDTDPAFNSAATGDFSRPAASGEMDTTYGGQTWTVWGAIQAEALSLTPAGATKVQGAIKTNVRIE